MQPPHHHPAPPPQPFFHSTVSIHKLRRIAALVLVLRFFSFCFSLASSIFTATTTTTTSSSSWFGSGPFRLLFAANALVAVYSLLEMGTSVWEILKASTLLPEPFQLWFDFAHDQVFAYLLVAASASAAATESCAVDVGFCLQSYISIALGFVGFVFLAIAALVSGFRVACFLLTGSRSHL